MNRTFLKGLGLEQEAIDSIMAEYGRNIESLNTQIADLTAENKTTSEKLKAFDGVDIDELKNRIQTVTNDYEDRIKNMTLDSAIEKALSKANAKHSSLLSTKFDKSKLTIEKDGTIKGLDEQLASIKENYNDLFVPEAQGQNPANPDGGNSNSFDFGFTSVRGTQE